MEIIGPDRLLFDHCQIVLIEIFYKIRVFSAAFHAAEAFGSVIQLHSQADISFFVRIAAERAGAEYDPLLRCQDDFRKEVSAVGKSLRPDMRKAAGIAGKAFQIAVFKGIFIYCPDILCTDHSVRSPVKTVLFKQAFLVPAKPYDLHRFSVFIRIGFRDLNYHHLLRIIRNRTGISGNDLPFKHKPGQAEIFFLNPCTGSSVFILCQINRLSIDDRSEVCGGSEDIGAILIYIRGDFFYKLQIQFIRFRSFVFFPVQRDRCREDIHSLFFTVSGPGDGRQRRICRQITLPAAAADRKERGGGIAFPFPGILEIVPIHRQDDFFPLIVHTEQEAFRLTVREEF